MRSVKKIAIFLLLIIILSACADNLWGSYDPEETPTRVVTRSISSSQVWPTSTASLVISPSLSSTLSQVTPTKTRTPPTAISGTSNPAQIYSAQSGDSLQVVATHFGVEIEDITSAESLPDTGFITPGTILFIPNKLGGITTSPAVKIFPDSEIVYGPSAVDFDIDFYVEEAGGYLSTFSEYLADPGWTTGAGSIQRLALESSINPRFMLAYLEYKSGWVRGDPLPGVSEDYPLGYINQNFQGLYQQMRLMVQELDAGYYGWRAGTLTELAFPDGSTLRIAPELNAGTVAIQYLFSRHLNYTDWLKAIDLEEGFPSLHFGMFGDPWERASLVEPLFPPGMIQPDFSFPFEAGIPWNYTQGPHPAWEQESARSSLDFAPSGDEPCDAETTAWVVAIAPGRIVRSAGYYVLIDLDGDRHEQTGWVVLYMHIPQKDRIPEGVWVDAGDRIGHPSCKGGVATGTHVHIARKYNGEWLGAGGALPFVLSGWTAHAGEIIYDSTTLLPYYFGSLTKGDQIITSSQVGSHESQIIRQPDE